MRTFSYFLFVFFVFQQGLSQSSPECWRFMARDNDFQLRSGIRPRKFSSFRLDTSLFYKSLVRVPNEQASTATGEILTLPMPDGSIQRFSVKETDVFPEQLRFSFPLIRTYSLRGIDDRGAHGTLDRTVYGVHAMIRTATGTVFLDPALSNEITDAYIAYYTRDFVKNAAERSHSNGDCESGHSETLSTDRASVATCVGAQLRSYRIVVACTGEYAKAATSQTNPTLSQTLSKIVTTINRVTGIFESETAIRLQLAPTTTAVIFLDPATDPFTGNNNASTLINESQSVISSKISGSAYDIGHTFSTGAGGFATLGVVCKGTEKARGVTGLINPVGDPYDVDYVSHEIGHQFNARHTYNAITSNCNGQRESLTAVEPGSGITIMGYAGICGANDLAVNSIPYFHAVSYDEIIKFAGSTAGSCALVSASGNQAPSVSTASAHVVPRGTPFILTGSAVDPDGDALTYSWEETDVAAAAGNWNSGQKPYFRSYPPSPSPSRSFPSGSVVLSGNLTGTRGEYLSDVAQTLNFRLTARDNRQGGGGVCSSTTTVTLSNSGPFRVSYPSAVGIAWPIGGTRKILWDVNGSDQAPVSCDSVRISISDNSGGTYSIVTAATANDGEFDFTVPKLQNTISTCRIKIECRNNIFYDISDNNFAITTDTQVGVPAVQPSHNIVSSWPNPCREQVTIGFEGAMNEGACTITVFDVLGVAVLEQAEERFRQSLTLRTSQLPAGMYLVRLRYADEQQSVLKIIKE